jgi:phage terminase large subunit GpA-like protein
MRDREYFTQLCSERITVKHTNGFRVPCWVKSPTARNEAFDCRVYALTALQGVYQHGFRLEQHCQRFELMCSLCGSEHPKPQAYRVIKSRVDELTLSTTPPEAPNRNQSTGTGICGLTN